MKQLFFYLFTAAIAFSCVNPPENWDEDKPVVPVPLQPTKLSFDFDIPENFSWSIFNQVDLEIKVSPQSSDDYSYVVDVYADSLLLESGYVTAAAPFCVKVDPLQVSDSLTVYLKNIYGKTLNKKVLPLTQGAQLSYTFPTVMKYNAPRKASRKLISIPSGLLAIPANKQLVAGESYHIPAGQTVSNLKFANNVTLYNEGEISGYSFQLYGVKIYNKGRIMLTGGLTTNSCIIENEGTISFDNGNLDTYGTTIKNSHIFRAGYWYARGYDKIYTSGEFLIRNNTSLSYTDLTIQTGGMFRTNYYYSSSGNLVFEANSKLIADYNYSSSYTRLKNTSDEYGVIIGAHFYVSNRQHVSGKICIDCANVTGSGTWAESVVIGNPGKDEIVIPATEYNANGYNSAPYVKPTPGVDYTGQTYTVVMEDGFLDDDYVDMDMNDMVCDWNYGTLKNTSGKITKIGLKFSVKAVGASKDLAAAMKVNALRKDQIKSVVMSKPQAFTQYFVLDANGIEKGNSDVVIPLFEDIHELFGIDNSAGTSDQIFVNTNNFVVDPYTFSIEITLKDPIASNAISASDFDFFLVTYGDLKSRREIHLFGNSITAKASNLTDFTISKQVWGMQFNQDFRYPLEYQRIELAYPKFTNWANTGGESDKDWYNYPVESKVITYPVTPEAGPED